MQGSYATPDVMRLLRRMQAGFAVAVILAVACMILILTVGLR
jgi:hypothetical protein